MSAVLALGLLAGCAPPEPARGGERRPLDDDALPVRWIPVSADETWDEAAAGLTWSLLALGAEPTGALLDIRPQEDGTVEAALDPSALGLSAGGLAALEAALVPVRESDAVAAGAGVDIGRLLMRTLYEPWVYYAVTSACADLDGWLAGTPRALEEAAITASMLTVGDRRIAFPADTSTIGEVRWLAEEGEGSLSAGTFVARATEVVDVMPNGRFRYAIYDADGALTPTADPAHTPAGGPGRCMWCHEWHLMPTVVQPDVEGYVPYARFLAAVERDQGRVDDWRAGQGGAVDWSDPAVHTWAERLVDGFLTPSTDRLAREWGVDAETVEAWMIGAGAAAITDPEFPAWGTTWRRADADAVQGARAATLGAPLETLDGYRDVEGEAPTFGAGLAGADCGP